MTLSLSLSLSINSIQFNSIQNTQRETNTDRVTRDEGRGQAQKRDIVHGGTNTRGRRRGQAVQGSPRRSKVWMWDRCGISPRSPPPSRGTEVPPRVARQGLPLPSQSRHGAVSFSWTPPPPSLVQNRQGFCRSPPSRPFSAHEHHHAGRPPLPSPPFPSSRKSPPRTQLQPLQRSVLQICRPSPTPGF